jgi:hypothetical protein
VKGLGGSEYRQLIFTPMTGSIKVFIDLTEMDMDINIPLRVANGNFLRIIMCASDTYDTLSTVNLDYGGTSYSLKLRTELAP